MFYPPPEADPPLRRVSSQTPEGRSPPSPPLPSPLPHPGGGVPPSRRRKGSIARSAFLKAEETPPLGGGPAKQPCRFSSPGDPPPPPLTSLGLHGGGGRVFSGIRIFPAILLRFLLKTRAPSTDAALWSLKETHCLKPRLDQPPAVCAARDWSPPPTGGS